MTRYHVSDVGDDSDGLTWAKAFNNITHATVLAATGGTDEIWVDKDHTEGATAASTDIAFTGGTFDDPLDIISVDKDASDAYTVGALIDTSGATRLGIKGNINVLGVNFTTTNAASHILLCFLTSDRQEFRDCVFTSGEWIEQNGGISVLRFFNCTLVTADTADGLRLDGSGALCELRKCLLTHTSTSAFNYAAGNIRLLCEDCDFGTDSDSLIAHDSGENNCRAVFRRCKLKSGYTLFQASNGPKSRSTALVEASTAATDATPLGMQWYEDYYGTVKSTLVQRRDTDGAHDGVQANEHSWEMVANAKTREFRTPLKSPPITVWVAGGSELTFKIFVASTAALQNDECWIELSGPDNTATSTTQGYRETTKMGWSSTIEGDPFATPANLTTDAVDDWVGTDTGTPQEMEITYTPDQAGPVTIRVCLAKAAGVTIYVDPKIEVT